MRLIKSSKTIFQHLFFYRNSCVNLQTKIYFTKIWAKSNKHFVYKEIIKNHKKHFSQSKTLLLDIQFIRYYFIVDCYIGTFLDMVELTFRPLSVCLCIWLINNLNVLFLFSLRKCILNKKYFSVCYVHTNTGLIFLFKWRSQLGKMNAGLL